jgi:hypothetical protein
MIQRIIPYYKQTDLPAVQPGTGIDDQFRAQL